MQTYAIALTYAIPCFVLLVIIEHLFAQGMKIKVNHPMDTVSSLSSGITNTLKTLMGISIAIIGYEWMVKHLAIFKIESNLLLYVITFIGLDFAGYWTHRFEHTVNVLWNRHIIHHSSEEFNLSCALRQNVSAIFKIYFFLDIPLALLGVPTEIIAIVYPIHFFAQFWYHTRLIDKMGFLEHIIVTPSHHRVHHAINDRYIDKNYSQIFIVWDKWFGTFQEELPEEPPVYGVKKAVRTWNPFIINFMHLWQLIKDAWRTQNWWDKIRIWFMPTGWRPDDMKEKYPITVTTDPYQREKYSTQASTSFVFWSWAQLIITVLLMFHLLLHFGDFSSQHLLLYAGFLMVSIFSYTTLMDRHPLALPIETLKLVSGFALFYYHDGWFGLNHYISGANVIIPAYFIASFLTTAYFQYVEGRKSDEPESDVTTAPSSPSRTF